MSSIYYIFFFFLEFRIPNYVLVFIQEWLLQTNNNISKGQDDPSQKADLHSDPVSFHRHWMRPGFFSSHHERLPSQWGPLLWIYVATEDPFNISSGMLYTIPFKEAWELFNYTAPERTSSDMVHFCKSHIRPQQNEVLTSYLSWSCSTLILQP